MSEDPTVGLDADRKPKGFIDRPDQYRAASSGAAKNATSFLTLNALPELVNQNAALVRRGRFLSLSFIMGIGDDDWLIEVKDGKIASATSPPKLMSSSRFAIRAPAPAWKAHWEALPAPGYHDIFAMIKSGHMTITGDLHPLMANLRYVKEVLAAPRIKP